MSIDQSVLDKFEAVVESQRKRIMDMKAQDDFIDYSKLDKLIIGVCGGDGIGPMITGMAQHALEVLLADKVKAGKVEFRVIDGLTPEGENNDRQIDIPVESPEEELADKIGLAEVLESLPEEDRLLIRLRFYANRTQSETAKVLHTTQVQISRRERKILRKMRERLLE